jgi:large subunit ribosomal protein L15
MPLQRRLPKRGFTNIFKKNHVLINIKDLRGFDADATLDIEALKDAGLVKRSSDRVKLLGNGEIKQPLTVKVHKASRQAAAKIEAAGGKIEII